VGDDARAVLGRTVEICTIVGLAAAIWSLPTSGPILFLLLTDLVLVIVCVALLQLNQAHRTTLEQSRSENERLMFTLSRLDGLDELSEGMIALLNFLSQEPIHDSEHHYSIIRERYVIDNDDATYETELQGRRVVEGYTSHLIVKIAGDTPVDQRTILPTARSLDADVDLPVSFIRDDPYFKILAIELAFPLELNDSFNITLSFRWAGSFPRARQHDYLFSAWGYVASLGVDRIEGLLLSDVPLHAPVLEELRDGRHKLSAIQPKHASREGGRRSEVSWAVDNPDAVYLLRFEKLLP
jgi:hypothetical protein